jgi:hypothetical protein
VLSKHVHQYCEYHRTYIGGANCREEGRDTFSGKDLFIGRWRCQQGFQAFFDFLPNQAVRGDPSRLEGGTNDKPEREGIHKGWKYCHPAWVAGDESNDERHTDRDKHLKADNRVNNAFPLGKGSKILGSNSPRFF